MCEYYLIIKQNLQSINKTILLVLARLKAQGPSNFMNKQRANCNHQLIELG